MIRLGLAEIYGFSRIYEFTMIYESTKIYSIFLLSGKFYKKDELRQGGCQSPKINSEGIYVG